MVEGEEEFQTWLLTGLPGTRYEYWRGFLARDRVKLIKVGPGFMQFSMDPADTIGSMALEAYEAGRVILFQRREGPGEWTYIAEMRPREATATVVEEEIDVEHEGEGWLCPA